jgi:hypothetical protein
MFGVTTFAISFSLVRSHGQCGLVTSCELIGLSPISALKLFISIKFIRFDENLYFIFSRRKWSSSGLNKMVSKRETIETA